MIQQAIRGALQTQLLTLGWTDQTAFEDKVFEPDPDVPFQEVHTQFIEPNSYALKRGFQERGIFQVKLLYPVGQGVGPSGTRAALIRAAFARDTRLPASGPLVVKIMGQPSVVRVGRVDDRDVTLIRARFSDR